MRIMRNLREVFAIMIACVIALALVNPFIAKAADDTAGTKIDKSGILQINVYHQDQNSGKKYFIQSGSGFLISDSEEGSQYVITCDHVAEIDDATKKEACEAFGVQKLNIKIEAVVTRDITQTAKIIKASQIDDFAILKLDAPIYQKNAMVIRPEGADLTEDVYAMGFPADIMNITDFNYYTEDQVTVSKGSVSLCEMSNNGVPYVQHSAVMTRGCSGGPLVDANGYVVGLNTFVYTIDQGSYYYSLKISEVTNALDMLGINYLTPDGTVSAGQSDDATTEAAVEAGAEVSSEDATEATEATTEAVVLDTAALDSALSEATGYMASDYTEDSFADLETAIDDAKSVKNNSDATQSDIDRVASNLQKAIDGLQEATNTTMIIIIVIAAVVVVVIVVVIILVVKAGKKNNEPTRTVPTSQSYSAMPTPAPTPIAPVSPVASVTPVAPARPTPPVPPQNSMSQGPQYSPSYMNEGAGETSVLGYGTGETTVLSGSNQAKATLTRLKTNEKVDITKQLFRVGKERSKVDYCITNNNSVSRIHADIVYKNGQYFIIDNNSTNYTFVNGQMIPAKQEVALSSGDNIKFAEEEFTFTVA